MLKIFEKDDPKSCFNRAADVEPVFVLLGRDASAPSTVRWWCEDRVMRGKNKPDDAQIVEAMSLADAMEQYIRNR